MKKNQTSTFNTELEINIQEVVKMEFPLLEFIEEAKSREKSVRYIEEITYYVKNLESKNFPVIFTRQHFAFLLQIQSDFLKYLLDDIDESLIIQGKYNSFKLKKRNGGERVIMAPQEDIKYLQKWIQFNILNNHTFEESCVGFIQGKSIIDNAQKHEFAKTILKVDLLHFFDTIDVKRVFGCFKKMGYIGNVCYDFAQLCTVVHKEEYWDGILPENQEVISATINKHSRVLPQGAPTSPLLANIIASKMDRRFERLGTKLGFNYTRYADDLTFSIREEGQLPSKTKIYQIIEEENFYPNKKKTKYLNKGGAQYVTGLTVANGVNLSKTYRKEIERHIYFCRKYGVDNHLKKKRSTLFAFNRISFHDWLHGHLCYIKSVNPKCYDKLIVEFNKIYWYI